MEVTVIRRFLLAVLLLVSAVSARAAAYTDVWLDIGEPGWGVFVVQSETFQFLAFFIYGPTGQPTWYTAQLNDDGTGNYAGPLFASSGSYFASPWQGYAIAQAGTVSFQPIDLFHATLIYSLTNGPTVSKTIQRQTLTPFNMNGTYSGSVAGTVSGCTNPADNITSLAGRFNLAISQSGDTSAALTFTFVDTTYSGMVCTLSGPLTHYGQLYTMSPAQYACTGGPGFSTGGIASAVIDSFHEAGQGIEGHWTATTSTGCKQSIRFASVIR
jgi:hypothetical protein